MQSAKCWVPFTNCKIKLKIWKANVICLIHATALRAQWKTLKFAPAENHLQFPASHFLCWMEQGLILSFQFIEKWTHKDLSFAQYIFAHIRAYLYLIYIYNCFILNLIMRGSKGYWSASEVFSWLCRKKPYFVQIDIVSYYHYE